MSRTYPRIAALKTAAQFEAHVAAIGATLPFEAQVQPSPESPLAAAIDTSAGRAGNRFSILPMEGWDGTTDGRPTDLTRRRWQRFGESGAKLIWGGEAFAVRHDGRANPEPVVPRADIGSRPRATARGPARRTPWRRSRHRRSRHRLAVDAFRALCAARPRQAAEAARGLPAPGAGSSRKPERTGAAAVRRRPRRPVGAARAGRGARAARRLHLRRRQALPRLPGARVALGADARGPLRR